MTGISYRRSSRDCLVRYGGNFYSVPAAYACQRLLVKETAEAEALIFSPGGDEIARHRLSQGHYQRVVRPGHYAGLKAANSRPGRGGAVQSTPLPSPPGEWLAAPAVETRPLAVYEKLLESPL